MISAAQQAVWLEGLRSRERHLREQALADLCSALEGPLFQSILRITCNSADAEDALQETWIDLVESLAAFRGESKLSTWLYRIAIRQAARIRNQRASKAMLELDQAGDPSAPEDPARHAQELDDARRLLTVLARLPLEQRVVLGLSAGDALPQAEIAAILGIPEGTVSSRLFAARENLRQRLERR